MQPEVADVFICVEARIHSVHVCGGAGFEAGVMCVGLCMHLSPVVTLALLSKVTAYTEPQLLEGTHNKVPASLWSQHFS